MINHLRAFRGVSGLVMGLALFLAWGSASPKAASPSLEGKLLVAAESIRDPRFAEAVIFVIYHDEKGALGLIVNRLEGRVPLAHVMEALGKRGAAKGDVDVFWGGPVELERGFVLHTLDYKEMSTRIAGRFAMTATPDVMRAIAEGSGPHDYIVAFGYAGWGAGQLEAELKANTWQVIDADNTLVFGEDQDGKWRRALAKRGTDL